MASILRTDSIQNVNTTNLITQTNATTITLGASGQTIVTATGATFSGGGLVWSSVQTTNFTAAVGYGYFLNTSANSTAITVTLPSTAIIGNQLAINDYSLSSATYPILINSNGLNIQGSSSTHAINNNGETLTLVYSGSTNGWSVASGYVDILSGLPGAPTGVTASLVGSTGASVSYTAPSTNGGSTITTYTATSNPGNLTSSVSTSSSGTISFTNLNFSTNYTFTVTATNIVGKGPVSSTSNSITTLSSAYSINYAIIAGGGAGNQGYINDHNTEGGGGGAGGVLIGSTTLTPGSTVTTVIGAGGAFVANLTNSAPNGSDSYTTGAINTSSGHAIGGGGGGMQSRTGASGGSGGGAQGGGGGTGAGSGTSGQGNPGGPYGGGSSGGGGGYGSSGGNTGGGSGYTSPATGSTYAYGGNGTGGGGSGSSAPANSGAGGGGGADQNTGGSGGSGVVMFYYSGSQRGTGGSTVYSNNGYTIHLFTGSGTFTA